MKTQVLVKSTLLFEHLITGNLLSLKKCKKLFPGATRLKIFRFNKLKTVSLVVLFISWKSGSNSSFIMVNAMKCNHVSRCSQFQYILFLQLLRNAHLFAKFIRKLIYGTDSYTFNSHLLLIPVDLKPTTSDSFLNTTWHFSMSKDTKQNNFFILSSECKVH